MHRVCHFLGLRGVCSHDVLEISLDGMLCLLETGWTFSVKDGRATFSFLRMKFRVRGACCLDKQLDKLCRLVD